MAGKRDPLAAARPAELIVNDVLESYLGQILELDRIVRTRTKLIKDYDPDAGRLGNLCTALLQEGPDVAVQEAAADWLFAASFTELFPSAPVPTVKSARGLFTTIRGARADVINVLARAAARTERGLARVCELVASGALDPNLEAVFAEVLIARRADLPTQAADMFVAWLGVAQPEPGRAYQRAGLGIRWALQSLPATRAYELLAPCFQPLDDARAYFVVTAPEVDWKQSDPRWRDVFAALADNVQFRSRIPAPYRT